MQGPVASAWFEVEGSGGARRRLDLEPGPAGRLVLGAPGGPLGLVVEGGDRLHLSDDSGESARIVFAGQGERPLLNGAARDEAELEPGDRLEWRGCVLIFRRAALLEQVVEPTASDPTKADAAGGPGRSNPRGEGRLWRRVKSGLLVELGLVPASASQPWQEAVRAGALEPDECARALVEVELSSEAGARLLERTARLQRDLLMAPLQSGAQGNRRRAKAAAKRGLAYGVAQLLIVVMFVGLALVGLLVGRLLLGWSVDGFLDGIGSVFGA